MTVEQEKMVPLHGNCKYTACLHLYSGRMDSCRSGKAAVDDTGSAHYRGIGIRCEYLFCNDHHHNVFCAVFSVAGCRTDNPF